MRSKRVETAKLRFIVLKMGSFIKQETAVDLEGEPIDHAWYVYETTKNQYLCRDGAKIFLSCHMNYCGFGSLLAAPGWCKTREQARDRIWLVKRYKTIEIRYWE